LKVPNASSQNQNIRMFEKTKKTCIMRKKNLGHEIERETWSINEEGSEGSKTN